MPSLCVTPILCMIPETEPSVVWKQPGRAVPRAIQNGLHGTDPEARGLTHLVDGTRAAGRYDCCRLVGTARQHPVWEGCRHNHPIETISGRVATGSRGRRAGHRSSRGRMWARQIRPAECRHQSPTRSSYRAPAHRRHPNRNCEQQRTLEREGEHRIRRALVLTEGSVGLKKHGVHRRCYVRTKCHIFVWGVERTHSPVGPVTRRTLYDAGI